MNILNTAELSYSGGSVVKNLTANAGDLGSIPGSGRSPGEGNGKPLQYSCLKFHGQRSLVGYSPWGCEESDTTEQRSTYVISLNCSPTNGQDCKYKDIYK